MGGGGAVGTPEERLEELGIELPRPQRPVANYVSAVQTVFFAAGAGPPPGPDGAIPSGKVGRDFTVEERYERIVWCRSRG